MRRLIKSVVLLLLLAGFIACHPGPVIGGGPKQPVGGAIAGMVTAADGSVVLTGRKVTAIEVNTQTRYDTTTAANGGYTIQVPEGTYRLELELRPSETLIKTPAETHIQKSDVDAGRDFVVTIKPPE